MPFGIAKIYNMTTKALGFGWNGAGKTMGLAAYGHTVPNIAWIYSMTSAIS
jgi:predicted NodU family carbamoyl transferase